MSEEPKYLNIRDAAAMLGVERKKIQRMIKAGELEAIQSPVDRRERLVLKSSIDSLLDFAKKIAA